MELEFLPDAARELEIATAGYEAISQRLGVRFRGELERICKAVEADPLLWRLRPGGYRRVNFRGFPYYLAFFTREKRLIVAAVGHASRHPKYWVDRMQRGPDELPQD